MSTSTGHARTATTASTVGFVTVLSSGRISMGCPLGRRIGAQKPVRSNWNDDWKEDAACHPDRSNIPPATFFSNLQRDIQLALSTCLKCPVTEQCGRERADLESQHALSLSGVYGGKRYAPTKTTMPAREDKRFEPGRPKKTLNRGSIPDRIMSALQTEGSWMTRAELCLAVDASHANVDQALRRLQDREMVERRDGERVGSFFPRHEFKAA